MPLRPVKPERRMPSAGKHAITKIRRHHTEQPVKECDVSDSPAARLAQETIHPKTSSPISESRERWMIAFNEAASDIDGCERFSPSPSANRNRASLQLQDWPLRSRL